MSPWAARVLEQGAEARAEIRRRARDAMRQRIAGHLPLPLAFCGGVHDGLPAHGWSVHVRLACECGEVVEHFRPDDDLDKCAALESLVRHLEKTGDPQ